MRAAELPTRGFLQTDLEDFTQFLPEMEVCVSGRRRSWQNAFRLLHYSDDHPEQHLWTPTLPVLGAYCEQARGWLYGLTGWQSSHWLAIDRAKRQKPKTRQGSNIYLKEKQEPQLRVISVVWYFSRCFFWTRSTLALLQKSADPLPTNQCFDNIRNISVSDNGSVQN